MDELRYTVFELSDGASTRKPPAAAAPPLPATLAAALRRGPNEPTRAVDAESKHVSHRQDLVSFGVLKTQ